MSVNAKWTGSYPCLCFGRWILEVDGKDVSKLIPPELRTNSMNTFGTYQSWHFENWMEVFEDYEDGLGETDWIEGNKDWLSLITDSYETMREIYNAIASEDFRRGSCGGCI